MLQCVCCEEDVFIWQCDYCGVDSAIEHCSRSVAHSAEMVMVW